MRSSGSPGGFAERCVVDADRRIPLPASIPFRAAAVLRIAYTTAMERRRRAGVTAGDRVLIPDATGGVGVAAVRLDVEPAIDRRYALEQTAAAFAALANRVVLGKLVVRPAR